MTDFTIVLGLICLLMELVIVQSTTIISGRVRVHEEINKLRRLHGVHPLELGGSISGRASKIARESLSDFLKDVLFNPVQGSFLHENAWEQVGTTVHVVPQDLDEYSLLHGTLLRILAHQKYNYGQPENEIDEHTQAFTQMLWANTKEIDYAYVQVRETDGGGLIHTVSIAVLIYSPVGNVQGKFAQNVQAMVPEGDMLGVTEVQVVTKVAMATEFDQGATFIITAKILTLLYELNLFVQKFLNL